MRNNSGRIPRHGRASKQPRNVAVTASRFREARQTCSLTVPAAAKLLRVTERTLQNWESGRARVPYAAYKLMRVLRGGEMLDAAWTGFRLHRDTLWTPEGHPFRPADLTWWSLTCRMADSFRALVSRPGLVIASGAGEVSAREASAEPPIPRSPVVQIADTPPSEGVLMVRAVPRSAEGGTPYSNHGVRTFRVTESPVCVGGAA
jgi:DNA-binding transcriptional regulator YiaG